MSSGQTNDTGFKTFVAGEALEAYRHVKVKAEDSVPAKVVYADAGERGVGVTTEEALAAGDKVVVALWNKPGSFCVEVAAAVATPGVALYAAADGKLSTVASNEQVAVSLEDASGSGSQVEVFPQYDYVAAS